MSSKSQGEGVGKDREHHRGLERAYVAAVSTEIGIIAEVYDPSSLPGTFYDCDIASCCGCFAARIWGR